MVNYSLKSLIVLIVLFALWPSLGKPESNNELGKPESNNELGKPESNNELGKPGSNNELGKPGSNNELGKPGSNNELGKPGSNNELGKPESNNELGKPESNNELGKPESNNEQRFQKLAAASRLIDSAIPLIREIIWRITIRNDISDSYIKPLKNIFKDEDIKDITNIVVPVINNNPYLFVILSNHFTAEEMNVFSNFLTQKETTSTLNKILDLVSSPSSRVEFAYLQPLFESIEESRQSMKSAIVERVNKLCTQQSLSQEMVEACKALGSTGSFMHSDRK